LRGKKGDKKPTPISYERERESFSAKKEEKCK